MKAPKIETGMIRGYVTTGDRSAGAIGKDQPECITAYTYWYRHDEDMNQLERELESIHKAYAKMAFWHGSLIGYETKPYRN